MAHTTGVQSREIIRDDPRTLALIRELGIEPVAAIGYLHLFWWWVQCYSPDGDISIMAHHVEAACQWHGNEGEFIAAMCNCGWILNEGSMYYAADWEETRGRTGENRAKRKARLVTDNTRSIQAKIGNPALPKQIKESEAYRLASLLNDLVHANYPHYKQPKLSSWATAMHRIILDGRDVEQIEALIRWLQTGKTKQAMFWRNNCRAAGKLRDKYPTLLFLMKDDIASGEWTI